MDLRGTVGDFVRRRWLAAVLTLGALVAVVFLLLPDFRIKRDSYQLVTLSSGEVYIGKLQGTRGNYLVLHDVYYQRKKADGAPETEITVVKLSSSVAKPEDDMYIASDKVVHWENLARDSKIVQVIEQDGDK